MRRVLKEIGLGIVNMTAIVLVIMATQSWLRAHFPVAGGLLLALLVLATYVAVSRLIERRVPSELSVSRLLPETTAGLALGVLLFTSVVAILWVARVYHPAGGGTASGIAGGVAFAVMSGVTEELLFRGLLFRLTAKLLGTWGALLFTAAIFGLAHNSNPGATVASSLAIAIEAGILLGAAYAATQRLWLPIGLHMGWNFAEGSIFSMTVSGNGMSSGLVHGSLSGPRLLTGGQFGPEASVVAVMVCLVAALYFIRRIVTAHKAALPAWSKGCLIVPAVRAASR